MGERIRNTSILLIGDWVTLKQNHKEYKGYVTKIVDNEYFCFYCTTLYEDGKEIKVRDPHFNNIYLRSSSYNCFKDTEIPLDEIEDKRHLIDLALLTKDDKWFRELVN